MWIPRGQCTSYWNAFLLRTAVAISLVFTIHNDVAKVMFLQVYVCQHEGRGSWSWGGWLLGGSLVRGMPGLGEGVSAFGPREGLGIPACTEADLRERRLLLRTVRILLGCILVLLSFTFGGPSVKAAIAFI